MLHKAQRNTLGKGIVCLKNMHTNLANICNLTVTVDFCSFYLF